MSDAQDREDLLKDLRDVRSSVLAAADDLLEAIHPNIERVSFADGKDPDGKTDEAHKRREAQQVTAN